MGVGQPANFLTDNHDVKSGRSIALYALLCIIWGSTWLVIKVGYGGLGPFNVAALRFFLAGAVLVPLVPLWARAGRAERAEWPLVTCVGLVLFAARLRPDLLGRAVPRQRADGDYLRHPADHLDYARALLPAGDRLTPRKVAGALLAFPGVVALFGDRLRLDASAAVPMLAIVASTVCAAARRSQQSAMAARSIPPRSTPRRC